MAKITRQLPPNTKYDGIPDDVQGGGLPPLYTPDISSGLGSPFQNIKLEDFRRVGNRFLTGNTADDLDRLIETRASLQPWTDQMANGLAKLVGKTSLNVAGSLAMIPTAIGVGLGQISDLATGEDNVKWSDFYDNAFQNAMDDASRYLDEKLPNYYTKAAQDYSIARQMGTMNFWADKFLGGMSFMLGAVLSEYASVGLANAAQLGKIAKMGKALEKGAKFDDVIKAFEKTGKINRLNQIPKIMRQLLTGAGYESGVEARHTKNDIMKGLIDLYRNENGKDPNEEELKQFEETADQTANAVFGMNMVLVGTSNALVLADTFGAPIKKLFKGAFENDLKGEILKQGTKYSARELSNFEKILKTAYKFIENPAVEGTQEGLQGAVSKGAVDYVMGEYSPEAADNTTLLSSIFNKGMAQAFGTTQGLEEVVIGGIMGMLGSPINFEGSSIKEAYMAYTGKDRDHIKDIAARNTNIQNLPTLSNAVRAINRQHELEQKKDKAIEAHDFFEYKNIENDQIFNLLDSRHDAGMLDTVEEDTSKAIDSLNEQEFKEQFGYDPNTSSEEIAKRKDEVKKNLKELINEYKKVREIAEKASISEDPNLVRGIANTLFGIRALDKREKELGEEVQRKTGFIDPAELKQFTEAGIILNQEGGLLETYMDKKTKLEKMKEDFAREEMAVSYKDQKAKDEYDQQAALVKLQYKGGRTEGQVSVADRKLAELQKELNETLDKSRTYLENMQKEMDKYQKDMDRLLEDEINKRKQGAVYYKNNFDEFRNLVERAVNKREELNKLYQSQTAQALNKDEVNLALVDLARIAKKRETLIKQYNYLNTKEGQQQFIKEINALINVVNAQVKNEVATKQILLELEERAKTAEEEADQEQDPLVQANKRSDVQAFRKTFQEGMAKRYTNMFTFQSEYFKNLGKVLIDTNTPIAELSSSEETEEEEDKEPDEKVELSRETEFPEGKGVVRSHKQLTKVYTPSYLHENGDRTQPLIKEVRDAIDSYEEAKIKQRKKEKNVKLPDISIKIEPYDTEEAYQQTKGNPNIFIRTGLQVDGKIYSVKLYINGQEVGAILDPRRFVLKRQDGTFYSLNPKIESDALLLNTSFVKDREPVKKYIKTHEKLSELWKRFEDGVRSGETEFGNELYEVFNSLDISLAFRSFSILDENEARKVGATIGNSFPTEKFGITIDGKKALVVVDTGKSPRTFIKFEGETQWKEVDQGSPVKAEINKLISQLNKETSKSQDNQGSKGRNKRFFLFEYNGQLRWGNFIYNDADESTLDRLNANVAAMFEKDDKGEFVLPYADSETLDLALPLDNQKASRDSFFGMVGKKEDGSKVSLAVRLTRKVTDKKGKKFSVSLRISPIGDSEASSAFINIMHGKNGYFAKFKPKGLEKAITMNIGKTFDIKAFFEHLENETSALKGKSGKSDLLKGIEEYLGLSLSNFSLLKETTGNYDDDKITIYPAHNSELYVSLQDVPKDQQQPNKPNEPNEPKNPSNKKDKSLGDQMSSSASRIRELMAKKKKKEEEEANKQEEEEIINTPPPTEQGTRLDLDKETEAPKTPNKPPKGGRKNKRKEDTKEEEESQDGGGWAFLTGNELDIKEFEDFESSVEKLNSILPDNVFTVTNKNTLMDNVVNKEITFGYFKSKLIYLADRVPFGAAYHEAFHAIFRTFLNDAQIKHYLEAAKARYGKPTQKALNELRASSSAYAKISNQELENLYYEEKMASDFHKYMNGKKVKDNVFTRFFKWLKERIKSVLALDDIDGLFHNIELGKFKKAKPVYNIYTNRKDPAYLNSARIYTDEDGNDKNIYTGLSARDTQMINYTVANELINKGEITRENVLEVLEKIRNRFHPDNWEQEIELLWNQGNYGIQKAYKLMDRIAAIYSAISPELIGYDPSNRDDGYIEGIPNKKFDNNVDKILKEVKQIVKFYELDDVETEIREEQNEDTHGQLNDEDGSENVELYGLESYQIGAIKSTSKAFKKFIATTFGQMDYFDLGFSEEFINSNLDKVKHTFPANPSILYNGILSALRNTEDTKLLKAFVSWSKYNPVSKLFVDRMLSQIREELKIIYPDVLDGTDVIDLPLHILEESNWYNLFKSSFHKVEEVFIDMVMEPPKSSGKSVGVKVMNANQNDVDDIQVSRWTTNFMRTRYTGQQIQKMLTGPDSPTGLDIASMMLGTSDAAYKDKSAAVQAFKNPALFEKTVMDVKNLFDRIGINLSKGYISYCLIHNALESAPDARQEANEFQKDLIDFYDSFSYVKNYELLTKDTLENLGYAFQSLHNKKAPISTITSDSKQGSAGRLKRIAMANSFFDENLMKTSIQNSKGENVYPIKLPSFDATTLIKWNSKERRQFIELLVEERYDDAFELFSKAFADFNYSEYLLKKWFNNLKNNIFLRGFKGNTTYDPAFVDSIFTRLMGYNLSGVRPDKLDSGDVNQDTGVESYTISSWSDEFFGNPATYSELDRSGKYLVKLGLFQDSTPTINTKDVVEKGEKKVPFRLIVPAVLEAKTTAKAVPLPVFKYTESGELTAFGLDALEMHFKTEYDRIKDVVKEIEDIVEGRKQNEIVENYHYTVVNGRRITKHKNEYYEITPVYELDKFNVNRYTGVSISKVTDPEIINKFKAPRGLKFFEFDSMDGSKELAAKAIEGEEYNKQEVRKNLTDFFYKQFNDFITDLASKSVSIITENQLTLEDLKDNESLKEEIEETDCKGSVTGRK